MKRLLLLAGVTIALALGGCQYFKAADIATTPVGTQTAVDLQKGALQAKLTFEAALIGIVAYIERPRCGRPTSPVLCSQQTIVDVMRTAIKATDLTTQAGEDAARTITGDTTVAAALVAASTKSAEAFKFLRDTYNPAPKS